VGGGRWGCEKKWRGECGVTNCGELVRRKPVGEKKGVRGGEMKGVRGVVGS